MQADRLADKLRRDDVAFEKLARDHDAERHEEKLQAWPALDERHCDRKDERDQRADVGNEAEDAGDRADQEAEIEPDQRQPDAVPQAEEQADQRLTADEASQRLIDLGGDLAQARPVVERQPAIDFRDHAFPVDQDVEGDHRGDDQEREETEDRRAAGDQRLERADQPLRALRDEIADRRLDFGRGKLLRKAELVEIAAEILVDHRRALFERQRLEPYCVSGKLLDEGDELIAEDGPGDDEGQREGGGEDDEDDQSRAERLRPSFSILPTSGSSR